MISSSDVNDDTINAIIDEMTLGHNIIQDRIIIQIPHFTGFLSMVGSSLIIWVILVDYRERLSSVYGRLLLMMSIFDIPFSFANMLSSIPVPRDENVFGSRGNTQSCEIQGFLFQLGIAVPLYNASLCFYFLLRIRYNVDEKTIAKKIEPFVHLVNICFAVGTSAILLHKELFNPKGGVCWIESYPFGCDIVPELIECTRGKDSSLFEFFFAGVPLGFSSVVVLCSMVEIYLSIRRKERLMRRLSNNNNNDTSAAATRNTHLLHAEKEQTAIIATLFVGAFLITYSVPIFLVSSAMLGKHYVHWILFAIQSTLLPLQGFWSFIIFMRPYVIQLRKDNPSRSYIWVLKTAFFVPRSVQRQIPLATSIIILQETDSEIPIQPKKSSIYHEKEINNNKLARKDENCNNNKKYGENQPPTSSSFCIHSSNISTNSNIEMQTLTIADTSTTILNDKLEDCNDNTEQSLEQMPSMEVMSELQRREDDDSNNHNILKESMAVASCSSLANLADR